MAKFTPALSVAIEATESNASGIIPPTDPPANFIAAAPIPEAARGFAAPEANCIAPSARLGLGRAPSSNSLFDIGSGLSANLITDLVPYLTHFMDLSMRTHMPNSELLPSSIIACCP